MPDIIQKAGQKMRQKKLKAGAVLLFLSFGLTGIQAQEVIPATGGNASGSGGTVSYSIGQVAFTTSTGTNGSVSQGVQQPYEISVITGLEEAKGITLIYTAYPNPAKNYIIVKVDASATISIHALKYQLYDSKGTLIITKISDGTETYIELENLNPATYFLKVVQSGKEIKSFKIIKN